MGLEFGRESFLVINVWLWGLNFQQCLNLNHSNLQFHVYSSPVPLSPCLKTSLHSLGPLLCELIMHRLNQNRDKLVRFPATSF